LPRSQTVALVWVVRRMAGLSKPTQRFQMIVEQGPWLNLARSFVCNLLDYKSRSHLFSRSSKLGPHKLARAASLVELSSIVDCLQKKGL
jgi:hypothetical protein